MPRDSRAAILGTKHTIDFPFDRAYDFPRINSLNLLATPMHPKIFRGCHGRTRPLEEISRYEK